MGSGTSLLERALPNPNGNDKVMSRAPALCFPFLPIFSPAGIPPEPSPPETSHPSEQFRPLRRKRGGPSPAEGKLEVLRFLSFKGQYLQNLLEVGVDTTPRYGQKKEITMSPCQCHNKTLSPFETGGFTCSISFRIMNSSSQFI